MKNIFKSILAVALSALAFTACADYNTVLLSDEMVALNSEKLSFDAIPTAPKTVTVNLDGDWIAVLPVECDWLKVEPSYGTGKTEVTITASENCRPKVIHGQLHHFCRYHRAQCQPDG